VFELDEVCESRKVLVFLGAVIALSVLAEAGVLVWAYLNADEVSCDLWGCRFTETRREVQTVSSRGCFENGDRINCSGVEAAWNSFD
jgi:hypothetical protein